MTDLKTTIEITGCIIRFLVPDADDPYAFDAAVAVIGDEGTATIKALTVPHGGYTDAHRRALEVALRLAGFHTAIWRRRKLRDGQTVIINRKQDLTLPTLACPPRQRGLKSHRRRSRYESRGLLARPSTGKVWTLGT